MIATLALAGCSGSNYAWERQGVQASADHPDFKECSYEATKATAGMGGPLGYAAGYGAEMVKQCMDLKGYKVVEVP
jgi:hypothetical protein